MTLSATKIRNVKPGKKTQKLYDGKGMYLEVTPKGSKRWRLRYRHNGKENTISLGLYPEVSLKEAREQRDENRKLLANGISPSEYRKSVKESRAELASNSFEAIAREWFEKHKVNWAESYSGRVMSRLERDIFPWIGGKPVAEIKATELLKAVQRIEKRNAIESAHRTLRICGQVFRYAIATARADRDPSADLKGALPPVKKGHMAAVTNPTKVAEILNAIDSFNGTLVVRCALQLAPLVFVRPGELRTAQWADINMDKGEWRFSVTKTNTEHIVPLSSQALEILREIKPLTGSGTYVFPNARTNSRPMSDVALLAALRRMGIDKSEMCVHGFRAMARTLLDEELGFRVDYIEHQLAHAVRDPNGRAYNRTKFLPERNKMMQSWADYLEQLKTKSNIITLKSKARIKNQ